MKPAALATLLFFLPVVSIASLTDMAPEDAVARIEVMAKKKPTKANISELSAALRDPDANIRVKERAAWALGVLDAHSAAPALIEGCKHKGLLVRSASLNALIRLRTKSALPTLISIAQSDPILSLRQTATLGLGLLQTDKAIDPLVKLSEDPTPEVRGASALAMAALQSKKNDFSEALKEMEADQNPYVQERAKKGWEVAQRKNVDVRAHLESTDADIRLFAAYYFQHHGNSKDLKALQAASDGESDDETRWQLGKSIKAIKKRAASKPPAPKKKAV